MIFKTDLLLTWDGFVYICILYHFVLEHRHRSGLIYQMIFSSGLWIFPHNPLKLKLWAGDTAPRVEKPQAKMGWKKSCLKPFYRVVCTVLQWVLVPPCLTVDQFGNWALLNGSFGWCQVILCVCSILRKHPRIQLISIGLSSLSLLVL